MAMKNVDALIGYRRLRPFPLDSSSVFATLSDLTAYASKGTAAYDGQIVSVLAVQPNSGTAVPYIITKSRLDGTLVPVQLLNADFDTQYVEREDFEKTSYTITTLYDPSFASVKFVPASGNSITYKVSVDTDDFVMNRAGKLSLVSALKTILEGLPNYESATDSAIANEVAARESLAGVVSSNKTELDRKIASEVSRAEGVESDIYSKIAGAFHFKGSVNTYADLPANPTNGDVYQVKTAYSDPDNYIEISANESVVWNGTSWEDLGGVIDLSNYLTKAETTAAIAQCLADSKSYSDDKATALSSSVESTYIKKSGDSELSGSFVPSENEVVYLGSASKKFLGVYSKKVTADALISDAVSVSGIAEVGGLVIGGSRSDELYAAKDHTHTITDLVNAGAASTHDVDSSLSSSSDNLPTSAAVLAKLSEYSTTAESAAAYAPIKASAIGNNYVIADKSQAVPGSKVFLGGLSVGASSDSSDDPSKVTGKISMEYDSAKECLRFSFSGA